MPDTNRRGRSAFARATSFAALALAATLMLTASAAAGEPAPAAPRPTLVFVHGLGGSPADWLEVANSLGRDHRVVFSRLPGHAHEPMTDSLPLEAAAQRLARTLRGLRSPAVLVGHSIGGAVAVRAALLEPKHVAGLVLVEVALRPQFSPADQADLRAALTRDFAGTIRAAYSGLACDSSQAEELVREAATVEPGAFARWLGEELGDDLSQRVAALRVPVLALFSSRSWLPGEPWSAAAESLGYARIGRVTPARLDSCGHFVMLDRAGELERRIREWEMREPRGQAHERGMHPRLATLSQSGRE